MKFNSVADVVKRFIDRLRAFYLYRTVSNTASNIIVYVDRRGFVLRIPTCLSNDSVEVDNLRNEEECCIFCILSGGTDDRDDATVDTDEAIVSRWRIIFVGKIVDTSSFRT